LPITHCMFLLFILFTCFLIDIQLSRLNIFASREHG
jgi:hypothetical protein